MKASTVLVGRYGENIAQAFLQIKGYRILRTNYQTPRGEIDIIAAHGEFLVFVEVKLRRTKSFGQSREAVGANKIKKLLHTSRYYIMETEYSGPMRFDLVAIDIEADVLQAEIIKDVIATGS